MKAIDAIFRFVLGVVFLFSGYVKAVDPLGMYYKIGDYLIAYDMQFLEPLAMFGAVAIIAVEVLLGFFFLFNLYPKFSSWLMLLVESFFTVLTFISWKTNAVSDCGCFGDAVKLTNSETFWKNVILMLPVLWLFFRRKRIEAWFGKFLQFVLAVVFVVVTLGFQYYNYNHLPIHDFRPYHKGADIVKQMELPEGAKQDIFATKLYYEKNGVVKEFTEDNFPWEDTTWVWKDTKTELVQKGDEAPIHDFSIMTEQGDDLLPMVLEQKGYKVLLVSYRLSRSDVDAFKAIYPFMAWCKENSVGFYPLTASVQADIDKLNKATGREFKFYAADEITLKTIVRSNPGLVLIKDTKIIGKWHYNDFPALDELKKMVQE